MPSTNTSKIKVAYSPVAPDVAGGVDECSVVSIRGRDYAVVPVVALVEGVRHPSGAPYPELVLADSFGRHVQTWNGRPVVVDHPTDAKGQPILASSPDVLENVYLGTMFDASLEDGKLKVNAYLDLTAIGEATDERVVAMWDRLMAGEVVEVSVGAIVYTEDVSGKYKGKQFRGKWSIVIPDHLAFLSEGTIGACSVEDGCGAFRIQSMGSIQLSEGIRMAAKQRGGTVRTMATKDSAALGDGGTLKTVRPLSGAAAGGCGCGGGVGASSAAAATGDAEAETEDDTEVRASDDQLSALSEAFGRMLFGESTYDGDRRAILSRALSDTLKPGSYPYVVAYSDVSVVYVAYDGVSGKDKLFEMGYTSDANDVVTLSGTAMEVEPRQKFVPKSGGDKGTSTNMNAKAATTTATVSSETKGSSAMSGDAKVKTYASVEELLKDLEGQPVGCAIKGALETASAAKTDIIGKIKKLKGANKLDDVKLAGLSYDMLASIHESLSSAAEATTDAGSEAGKTGRKTIAEAETEEDLQGAVDDETARHLPTNFAGRAGATGGSARKKSMEAPKAPAIFDTKTH